MNLCDASKDVILSQDGFGAVGFLRIGSGEDGIDGPQKVVSEASHSGLPTLADLDEIIHVHVGIT